jgi:hypothetical protein
MSPIADDRRGGKPNTWPPETLARLGGKFASRCGPTSAAVILDRIGLLARVKPPMAALHDAAERELRAAGVRLRSIPASAKLNDNDPQAWLADVLARLPGHPDRRSHELLAWNWQPQSVARAANENGLGMTAETVRVHSRDYIRTACSSLPRE